MFLNKNVSISEIWIECYYSLFPPWFDKDVVLATIVHVLSKVKVAAIGWESSVSVFKKHLYVTVVLASGSILF